MAKELESSKNHRVLVGTMMEQSSYSGHCQSLAFILAIACLGVATFLGVQGHDTLAGAIIAITAVLASIFYLKKIPKRDNSK